MPTTVAVRVPPDTSQVRAELDRILASNIFERSDRLSAYLRFIVERTLAGEGDTLKEQVIAIELYGKRPDFNPAADPIVRVDARRLRDRLREFYAMAPSADVVISVPKGTYTPEFTVPPKPIEAVPQIVVPARNTRALWIAGVAVVVAVLATWMVMSRVMNRRVESSRLLTVTSLPGAEEDPSLSPDGNFVAFSWGGPNQSLNHDIWVKAVDGDEMRQVTNTPDENERYPRWSPDGQRIAFTKVDRPTWSVWVISSLGGAEQLVTRSGNRPAWLPDAKSLVFARSANGRSSIVRHVLETGSQTTVTEAPVGFTDLFPRVDPSGNHVAFIRSGVGGTGVFVTSLTGGDLRQIGHWISGVVGGIEWTPDGLELIYARREMSGRVLVRARIDGSQPPIPLAGLPLGSVGPSTSRPKRPGGRYRLAFASGEAEISLRLIDLQAERRNGTIDGSPFADVTRVDIPGRFSRDGSQIAFMSDRSGLQQVWVARRDQTGLKRLTDLRDATVDVGSWSPDGRAVAFNATIAGNTDIYVASIDGGPLLQLTNSSAIEADPEWSRDGRWIYYASNETGSSEIWRMSPDGRDRRRLTSEGGFDPHESADGTGVYFVTVQRSFGLASPTTLRRVPAEGGPSTEVYSGIMPEAWDLAGGRVIFVRPRTGSPSGEGPDILAAYDLTTPRVDELGPIAYRIGPYRANRFLAASPDGRWVVTVHTDREDRDIFVLDNHR